MWSSFLMVFLLTHGLLTIRAAEDPNPHFLEWHPVTMSSLQDNQGLLPTPGTSLPRLCTMGTAGQPSPGGQTVRL